MQTLTGPQKREPANRTTIVKCAACGFCSESDERYETVTCIEWPKEALHPPFPWHLVPPCKAACPAGLDIRSYIDLAAHGHYEKALEVIEEKIPFPATIGRVCPHPCETKCNRKELGQAIAINGLKRFIADAVYARGSKVVTPAPRLYDARVAVIGAGPAGLTAAHNLARQGYSVTVFEAASVAGGMLTVPYRSTGCRETWFNGDREYPAERRRDTPEQSGRKRWAHAGESLERGIQRDLYRSRRTQEHEPRSTRRRPGGGLLWHSPSEGGQYV